MPIADEVDAVVNEGREPREAYRGLRAATAETRTARGGLRWPTRPAETSAGARPRDEPAGGADVARRGRPAPALDDRSPRAARHEPDWDRFVAAHDWATRLVPRFRQQVVEPALGLGQPGLGRRPATSTCTTTCAACGLPEGGGWTEVLRVAEQIAMTPFDRARSPWEAVLIEGLPDGKAAYLLKLHHSDTDGHRRRAAALAAALARRASPTPASRSRPRPTRSARRHAARWSARSPTTRARRPRRDPRRGGRAAGSRRPDHAVARRAALRRLAAPRARRPGRQGLAAAGRAQPLVALRRDRRPVRRPARRVQGRRRLDQRRVHRGAAGRLPPLPRGARLPDRAHADRDPDLAAQGGRRRRRQRLRRRPARRARWARRPDPSACTRSARMVARARARSPRSTPSGSSPRARRACPAR